METLGITLADARATSELAKLRAERDWLSLIARDRWVEKEQLAIQKRRKRAWHPIECGVPYRLRVSHCSGKYSQIRRHGYRRMSVQA